MKKDIEYWRDIPEYKGYYQVSNIGRVKGLKYTFWNGKQFRTIKERILKPNKNSFGYLYVVLHKNRKPKTWKIHRLVALAFIPNPENKKNIDHKNGNREDNRIENLRWCTQKENMNNPITRKKLKAKNKNTKKEITKTKKINSKPVICIETNKYYESMRAAGKDINFHPSNIGLACKGKIEKVGDFHWKYAEKRAS